MPGIRAEPDDADQHEADDYPAELSSHCPEELRLAVPPPPPDHAASKQKCSREQQQKSDADHCQRGTAQIELAVHPSRAAAP